jgi:hypothetical protein
MGTGSQAKDVSGARLTPPIVRSIRAYGREMALYVLIEREGRWWLAAAQNTPIRQANGALPTSPGS